MNNYVQEAIENKSIPYLLKNKSTFIPKSKTKIK